VIRSTHQADSLVSVKFSTHQSTETKRRTNVTEGDDGKDAKIDFLANGLLFLVCVSGVLSQAFDVLGIVSRKAAKERQNTLWT
jgi:hypothetical protein